MFSTCHKWMQLLPSHIQTRLCISGQNPQETNEPLLGDGSGDDAHARWILPSERQDAHFNPNNDVYMLRAKIQVLEDYIQALEDVLEQYDNEKHQHMCLRRRSI